METNRESIGSQQRFGDEANPGNDKIKEVEGPCGAQVRMPYKGVAVRGTDEEIAKYHSGLCPGCNAPVKWEEDASL